MKQIARRILDYTVIFDPAPEGGYTVIVPALPGIVTEGDTLIEARANATEAIVCHLESIIADGEPLPVERNFIQEKLQVGVACK